MTKQVALYKIPETFDVARVLDDSFLNAYNDSIQSYNQKAKETLRQFSQDNGDLTGSNPFMLVHLSNSGLLPEGTKLADRSKLEMAVGFDSQFLRGNYTDFGVALRTARDSYQPNNLLAKILAKELKERDISLDNGKLIPLSLLKNIEDKDSAYGLVFNLKEVAETEYIQDLDQSRWDYKRDEGVARAYLDRNGAWNSLNRDLVYSNGSGRVVVTSAEGTSQKFLEDYSAKLEKQRKELESQLEKIKKAEAILKGK